LYTLRVNWHITEEQAAPKPPKARGINVAVIGCGEIMNIAHLKAYQAAGITPIGCFDLNAEASAKTAAAFNIPRIYKCLEELVSDENVHIVDIAIHMNGRREAFEACCKHGKQILIQKPVAHSMAEIEQFVQMSHTAGVKVQVNQQARWAPTHAAVKILLNRGAVGRLNFIRFEMRGWQDDPNTWYVRQKNMTLVDHGVHYFDLIRFFAGREAKRVAAMHASVPGQKHISPVIYSAVIDFGDGLTAEHCFNNKVMTPEPWGMNIVLDGEEGSIFCDFETVRLQRRDGGPLVFTPQKKWFPDAFLGPMADLMDAVAENREPACSLQSNVGTMRLVFGALESAETGEFVTFE